MTSEEKKYTFVGYVRVSSRKQEKGLSKEAQVEDIKAYARLHGYRLTRIIEETCSTKDPKREGFLEALRLLEAGEAQGMICVKINRLCRHLGEFCTLVDKYFRKDQYKLVVIRERIDTTTSAGRLVANIMMSCAQNERDQIGEGVRSTFEYKRSRSEWLGGGVPLGYRVVYCDCKSGKPVPPKSIQHKKDFYQLRRDKKIVGKLERDTRTIEAIRFAKKLRGRGNSLRKISSLLQEEGFRPTSSARLWHPETVRKMISSNF